MPRQDETIWRLGTVELTLERPRVMGILNVTPDSFSDGGAHLDEKAAVSRAFQMLDEGADIIDVGGESTRPGFVPVHPNEEAERILGVVRQLLFAGALVSVDTRHPETARLCARLGVQVINDVTGFTNPAMADVAAESDCGLVICRSISKAQDTKPRPRRMTYLDSDPRSKLQKDGSATDARKGTRTARASVLAAASHHGSGSSDDTRSSEVSQPTQDRLQGLMEADNRASSIRVVRSRITTQRRYTLPEAAPLMRQVMGFLGDQARLLGSMGIAHERIALDPGAGFGTTTDEDVVIQRATAQMVSMGYPLICAVSRKRFVGAIADASSPKQRDAASLGVALASVAAGARIVRTHDVRGLVQALDAWRAVSASTQHRAFVALGSNVGDRVAYLARATKLIDELPLTCVWAVSDAYESDPALGIATPVANAVVEVRTELSPRVFLDHLLEIEHTLGRIRRNKENTPEPRTIDLDLVFYEGERSAGEHLVLPYQDLGLRDFVLVPMEDLMRDPERFLANSGVEIAPRAQRIGIVRADLGPIDW